MICWGAIWVEDASLPSQSDIYDEIMGKNLTRRSQPRNVIGQSKKSPTGPTERTPKPEYLISLAPYLGVRW